ncbi:histidine phosphatase family protein [Candidatus Woesebacteria bacterium]|nr:histidine phosphatase family protein [Candidatus Woesebacteria bacterium]QQG47185.1 MAG: histidine phosphatase family protein [Candidatus Woesebacteria bacterium]
MSTNLFLLRHAETFATINSEPGKEKYHDKVLTADILKSTVTPIIEISKYLKKIDTEKNLTSPVKRCRQTVEIITKHSAKKFEIDEDLREYYMENFESLKNRVENLVKKTNKYKNVLICTHGAVIAGIKHLILENDFKFEDIHDYPKPGVLIIIKDKKIEEKDFN